MSNKNEETIRRWFVDLWSKGDLDTADAIIAADYAPHWIQIPKKGPEQVKHEVRYFRSVFPDLRYTIVDNLSADRKVWVRYRGEGTQKGSAWGFAPTNQAVEFEGVTIFTLNETAQISDRWGAFCFYDILVDLGLAPPLWELAQHLD